MAAAVLIPLSTINQNGGILPASALTQHVPRHGRSRGMSMKGKSAKGRSYSIVEDSDVTVAKAVSFVLKRAVKADEVIEAESGDEELDYIIADAEGWVSVADLLQHPNLTELRVDLEGVQQAATSIRARFTLRQKPDTDAERADSYQVRQNGKRSSIQAPVLEGTPLTKDSANLPEYAVYETTYQAYPLILAFGSIKRADGATHSPFTVAKDGETTTPSRADVSIWVHLPTALERAPEISWQFTTTGALVTSEEVPKSLWKQVVGRRPDVGLLLEDGEVRKEVPEYLRGKGGKGKAKKGKGMLRQEGKEGRAASSESSEDSNNDEDNMI
ncbi:tRNA 2'-phosphotransferase 1 [Apiospora arundinis]|uniref:tRNA 2'-phosphotransferase 1 n=1 Tax=Apiospora arundinis TaxID=335852 RepID=A0ABR2JBC0_9PEZI